MYGYPPSTYIPPSHILVPMSEWSSGLCSCLEDINVCCYGFFCPGCSTMESRAALEMRSPTGCDMCFGCLLSVLSFYWFGLLCHGFLVMRNTELASSRFNITSDNTCLKSFCCLWCSVCQIEREISHRTKLGQLSMAPKPTLFMV